RCCIRELGTSLEFYYIESGNNPADIATRPLTKEPFSCSDWLSGPRWFNLKEANWPMESPSSPATETYDESQEGIDATPICAPTVKTLPQRRNSIIDLSRFRHYSQALRALTRAMKTLSQWIARVNAVNNRSIALTSLQHFSPDSELTSDEMKAAEHIILHEQTNDINIEELRAKHKDKNLFYDENHLIRAHCV
ncbi:hypothetical protein GCK32_022799, partial [Trichostrongylus colubriformis]